jgi:hypothetical protein
VILLLVLQGPRLMPCLMREISAKSTCGRCNTHIEEPRSILDRVIDDYVCMIRSEGIKALDVAIEREKSDRDQKANDTIASMHKDLADREESISSLILQVQESNQKSARLRKQLMSISSLVGQEMARSLATEYNWKYAFQRWRNNAKEKIRDRSSHSKIYTHLYRLKISWRIIHAWRLDAFKVRIKRRH